VERRGATFFFFGSTSQVESQTAPCAAPSLELLDSKPFGRTSIRVGFEAGFKTGQTDP
jgi:hypothetical protein